jgi:hypothetical protein
MGTAAAALYLMMFSGAITPVKESSITTFCGCGAGSSTPSFAVVNLSDNIHRINRRQKTVKRIQHRRIPLQK